MEDKAGVDADLKVLLVEDDPAVAEMYRYRLEIDGYDVVVAPDGETGLQKAAEMQPDLIYLDLRLPAMDGFTVLENLRRDQALKSVPVVILTNFSEPELVERGLKLGALDYLVKAETTPAHLSERMEKWMAEESVSSRGQPGPSQ
jgi:DNA-binding response OmpR family regulator